MKYKVSKEKKYNLHTIEVDNFRSCHFSLSFRSEFDPYKMAAFTLISDLITDSSKNFKTSKYVTRHMEESFIIDLYGTSSKVGKTMQTYIICNYVDPRYIDDKDFIDKTYKFIFEMISNPIIVDDGFDEKNFNIVKKRLIKDLNSLNGNNKFLTEHKAFHLLSEDPNISYHMYDVLDFINNLTSKDLLKYYYELISESYIDIFVTGSTESSIISKVIKKYYKFDNKAYKNLDELVYTNKRLLPKVVKEKSSFKQSTIVVLYNLSDLTMFEREFVMPYFVNILNGAGLNSKLYQNLREKNSLCYGVNTSIHDRINILSIKSTIKAGSEKKAISLIKQSVREMKNNISDKEFVGAYYAFKRSLKGLTDSIGAINRLYMNKYYGNYSDYETKLKKYGTITIDDIKKIYSKLKLNTIYVLKGDINERTED